jgi:hypothetical protein
LIGEVKSRLVAEAQVLELWRSTVPGVRSTNE